jgi:ribose-phosphate pyrophosphokinase
MNEFGIQCVASSIRDASRLAKRLGVSMDSIGLHRFPDGELRVTVGPAAATTVIYASLNRPNEKLISILFAAEALRRAGAKRIVLVAPYLCYMRQDIAFQKGEAISQKVIGHLLAKTVDRVITFNAHLHRTAHLQSVFPGIEVDNLSAIPAIENGLRADGLDRRTVVVGPDAESQSWVRELASRLGVEHVVAQKQRRGDRSVEIKFIDPTILVNRPTLLIDDIVSTGGTMIACAGALMAAGATAINAVVIHALLSTKLMSAFGRVGIQSIRSTFSVPHLTNSFILDDILVTALSKETSGHSVVGKKS